MRLKQEWKQHPVSKHLLFLLEEREKNLVSAALQHVETDSAIALSKLMTLKGVRNAIDIIQSYVN